MSHGLETDRRISREELLALRAQPAHVVGAASAEGVAVARLLVRLGFTDVTLHDLRPRDELRRAFRTTHGAYARVEQDAIWDELRPLLDRGRFAEEYLSGIQGAALVSLGQGWYLDESNRAGVVAAVPASARVTSMSALYAALHAGPVAAITGTNGKSTTVAIVEHLLDAAGVPHRASGNERSSRQFLPVIDDVPAGTWALMETSNRQLLQLASSPDVAAITSLTPDHLEEHDGIDGYRRTKARLFGGQRDDAIAVANADDAWALDAARSSPAAVAGRLVSCSSGPRPAPSVSWHGDELVADQVPVHGGDVVARSVVARADQLHLPGAHNRRNAAVAVAVALACGADPAGIGGALDSFAGKSLRLQPVATIAGVEVWNDLKSTTPEATCAALEALADRRVLLIAGGSDKGLDYASLAERIVGDDVRCWAVPGTATDVLARELVERGAERQLTRIDTLGAALDAALADAVSGDCVIVSPAAAAFWTTQLQGGASLARLVRDRAAAAPKEVPER